MFHFRAEFIDSDSDSDENQVFDGEDETPEKKIKVERSIAPLPSKPAPLDDPSDLIDNSADTPYDSSSDVTTHERLRSEMKFLCALQMLRGVGGAVELELEVILYSS